MKECGPAKSPGRQPGLQKVSEGYAVKKLRTLLATMLARSSPSCGTIRLGTTLNTYSHVIPASQRRAVERVSEVMFSSVLKLDEKVEEGKIN